MPRHSLITSKACEALKNSTDIPGYFLLWSYTSVRAFIRNVHSQRPDQQPHHDGFLMPPAIGTDSTVLAKNQRMLHKSRSLRMHSLSRISRFLILGRFCFFRLVLLLSSFKFIGCRPSSSRSSSIDYSSLDHVLLDLVLQCPLFHSQCEKSATHPRGFRPRDTARAQTYTTPT